MCNEYVIRNQQFTEQEIIFLQVTSVLPSLEDVTFLRKLQMNATKGCEPKETVKS